MKSKRIGIGTISIPLIWFDAILYAGLFALFLNMAFIRNFTDGKVAFKGEFSSDNGGYYIYLPATFIYGFSAENFPDSLDIKSESPFRLDKEKNKMITKYPSGVALLVAPFFLSTHLIVSASGLEADGFSIYYHRMVVVASVFYLILAMFILKSFFLFYFPRWLSYSLPFVVLLASNLYYYSMDDVLFTHQYTFFLLSLLLLTLKKYLSLGMKSFGLFIAISCILAVLILVRPTNILFISLLLFWDVQSLKEIRVRFLYFLRWKYILTFMGILILVFLPQIVYWHFISGKWIFYSYTGEGFSNWKHPMLIPFWFSPLNGWIPYTPLAILFLLGFVTMIIKRIFNGVLIAVLFLLGSYLYSSWSCWYFGGSFGCRPLIDFYPLFTVALGYLIVTSTRHKNLLIRALPFLFLAFSIYFNQRLFDRRVLYDGGTWSWEVYKDQLKIAGMATLPRTKYGYKNDFENIFTYMNSPGTKTRPHSGTRSTYMTEGMSTNCHMHQWLNTILDAGRVGKVSVSLWINPLDTAKTGAVFTCSIRDAQNRVKLNREIQIDDFLTEPNSWAEMKLDLHIPAWIDSNSLITFCLLNPANTRFYVDDFTVHYE